MPGAEAENETLPLSDLDEIQWQLMNTVSLSAENLIDLGLVVSEI